MLQLSCNTQEGVQAVKNAACERLLADRVAQKLKAGTTSSGAVGGRLADVMSRIHVAQPLDGVTREAFIPEAVKYMKKYDKTDPEKRKLARDVEGENGGAGVFNVDLRADYLLKDPAWKYDKVPELLDGKNVYDYIDPDIDAKLQALEEEEEKLEKEGFYDSEEDIDDSEEEILHKASLIREKQALIRNEARMRKSLKNRAMIPRKFGKKTISQLDDHLDELGVDTTDIVRRAREQSTTRGRSTTRSRLGTEDGDAMDVDSASQTAQERFRSRSRARSQPAVNRREDGVQDVTSRSKAERAAKLGQRKMNRMARQGEADRHVAAALPKHLVSLQKTGQMAICLSPAPCRKRANPIISSQGRGEWGRRLGVRPQHLVAEPVSSFFFLMVSRVKGHVTAFFLLLPSLFLFLLVGRMEINPVCFCLCFCSRCSHDRYRLLVNTNTRSLRGKALQMRSTRQSRFGKAIK